MSDPDVTSEGPYEIGQVVRMAVTVGDALTDPGAIALTIRKPNGTLLTPTPSHDGTGHYHYDDTVDEAGVWSYLYITTGVNAGSKETRFSVKARVTH